MRSYLVSYTAGQVLPTAVGGDASRIYESSRRHPGRLGDLTAIVLLERALGGVATLVLAAIGFALAVGRYDVGAYLWIEGAFVIGDDRARRPVLLAPRARAAAPVRAAAAPAAASSGRCARSTRACTSSAGTCG